MDFDIYRTYKFDFDQSIYLREFKKALDEHGVTKPAQFDQLLKDAGIINCDYETVKSYFYGRRVPPLNILIAVCKSLGICADSIAFPQSVQTPTYDKDISDCGGWFCNIFMPYNIPWPRDTSVNLTEFFQPDTYEKDVDEIALMLSKYNYLIQKYHYAAVSNDELDQIYTFTEKHIIDRYKGKLDNPQEIIDWMRDCNEEDFLKAFYDKYTISYYSASCHSLLNTLSTAIDGKFIKYAAQLLPEQDMF